MLLTGPFPTPSSTPRAPLSPIPIDNAVIRVACHRCITNQTGQRLRQKGPLSEHPSYGLHVSGAGPFSLSPARPSSLFLAIERNSNFNGNGELETNKGRPMEPLEPADRELAYSDPKKRTWDISDQFCFKLSFPNSAVLYLFTLAQSRNAVISASLATRGLPIRPPRLARPRLRMVTLAVPWRRRVAFHRPK